MRIIFSFLIFAVIIGCKSSEQVLQGKYESKEYSKLDMLSKHFLGYAVAMGSSLKLNKDSSFTFQTCGNDLTGNWLVSNDSLILNYNSNRWRNDSLNKNGFEGMQLSQQGTIKFKVKNSGLIRTIPARNQNHREIRIFEKLVKEK